MASLAMTPRAESRTERITWLVSEWRTSATMEPPGLVGSEARATVVRTSPRSDLRSSTPPPRMMIVRAEGALTFMSSAQWCGQPVRNWMRRRSRGSWKYWATWVSMRSSSSWARMTILAPSRLLFAAPPSSLSRKSVFSLQPSRSVCPVATMRLRLFFQESRVMRAVSTMIPSRRRLNVKPQTLKSMATVLNLFASRASKLICVPGSKNMPQENQKLWLQLSS
mmetsp:Transcript_11167/g.32998  ORF Transcript_11167/g.32998 Transcript_11167/m.32998 type:complete len:223 (-) Transcript_11167:499-1167(-)